jgi:diguanylate cyclase (GGDEF)-like protein
VGVRGGGGGGRAAPATVALENAHLHTIVKRQAVTDELTGLANRRSFLETLETELRRAQRFDSPLGLVFADLDNFKLVNDRFGHHAGDDVLRAFAAVLQGRIREIDLAARLGGEEFAVLLPETDASGSRALAEDLRAAVTDLVIESGAHAIRVTASFGVAAFPETDGADELMTAADLALYSAKRQGKNRVIAVGPNGA